MQIYDRTFRSKIIVGSSYKGYPLMESKGPFVARYLDSIISVVDKALAVHPRTYAFRFDLRLPAGSSNWPEGRLIDRFIASLKGRIQSARRRSARAAKNGRVHDTDFHYVYAREVASTGRPHFHFVAFVNRDAFNAIGRYCEGRDNLYSRLNAAWASALDLSVDEAVGLVHIPKHPDYWIDADDENSVHELVQRVSYFAKTATKRVGRRHSFGYSRGRRRQRPLVIRV